MNKLCGLIVQYPRTLIAISLAVTIVFFIQLVTHQVKLDGSPDTLIIKGDQSARFYNATLRDFGDDRVIVVVVESANLFTPDKIVSLRHLTSDLAALPGVAEALGITSVQYIRNEDDTIKVANLIPRDASAQDLAKIKDEATANSLFRGMLLSGDGRTTAINLILRDDLDDVARRDLAATVEDKIEANRAWTDDIYVTGEPVMQLHGTLSMRRDLLIFIPVTLVLIIIVFYISFKSWRGVLLPLLTVGMSVIWTLGLMSFLGKSLTVVTLSLPVVILAIGSSYVIHVINQYYISTGSLSSGHGAEERRQCVFDGLAFIKGPVLVSGTITMAGFLSLATNDIQGSREMGYFAAFGMFAATLLALTFVPALLVLLETPITKQGHSNYAPFLDGLLRSLGRIATTRQKSVYVFTFLLCIFSAVGFARLRINTDYRAFFPKSSPIYQAAEKLHKKLAGCATFEVVINGGRREAIMRSPRYFAQCRIFRNLLLPMARMRRFLLQNLVVALNGTVNGNPSAGLPEDKVTLDNLNKDYLSQDEDARRLITANGDKAVILVRTDFFASNQMREFLGKVENHARTVFPQNFTVNSTGIFVLLKSCLG